MGATRVLNSPSLVSLYVCLSALLLLAVEIFKSLNKLSPSIMTEIFKPKETNYELQTGMQLQSTLPRTANYGLVSITYLASNIWRQVPSEIKCCTTLTNSGIPQCSGG